jgi:hypothetical protein
LRYPLIYPRMIKRREIIHVSANRKGMRGKVREMEAFGWALDDYEETGKNMVRMKFLRPMDISSRDKLRKLEYAFSRLPGERSVLNLKTLIGTLICVFIASISWTALHSLYIALYILAACFIILAWYLNEDEKKLARRRAILLERATWLTTGGEEGDRAPGKELQDTKE